MTTAAGALASALDPDVRETPGDLAAVRDVAFRSADQGVTLSVTVAIGTNRLIVRDAKFDGGSDEQAQALGALCEIIAGRPLQEAADHGAIYALEQLLPRATAVQGIRTPHNAGPAFVLAERLIRDVHAQVCKQLNIGPRENRWYLRPGAEWLAKNEQEQAEQLKPLVADFLREAGIGSDDFWITRIERGTRVTVMVGDAVGYEVKPKLLMDFERRLRDATAFPLEVFMEEKKDANKIRRL